jgi:hypothetical protein
MTKKGNEKLAEVSGFILAWKFNTPPRRSDGKRRLCRDVEWQHSDENRTIAARTTSE